MITIWGINDYYKLNEVLWVQFSNINHHAIELYILSSYLENFTGLFRMYFTPLRVEYFMYSFKVSRTVDITRTRFDTLRSFRKSFTYVFPSWMLQNYKRMGEITTSNLIVIISFRMNCTSLGINIYIRRLYILICSLRYDRRMIKSYHNSILVKPNLKKN